MRQQRIESGDMMPDHTDELLENLTELFSELPGLGPRSASRIVGSLLVDKRDLAQSLAGTLTQALARAHQCPRCNTLTTASDLCPVCLDANRDSGVICVVERPADQAAIEASVAYRGVYFVLMGRVNPIQGVGPAELGIQKLLERLSVFHNLSTNFYDGQFVHILLFLEFCEDGIGCSLHFFGREGFLFISEIEVVLALHWYEVDMCVRHFQT